jgi:hypothetical protein
MMGVLGAREVVGATSDSCEQEISSLPDEELTRAASLFGLVPGGLAHLLFVGDSITVAAYGGLS